MNALHEELAATLAVQLRSLEALQTTASRAQRALAESSRRLADGHRDLANALAALGEGAVDRLKRRHLELLQATVARLPFTLARAEKDAWEVEAHVLASADALQEVHSLRADAGLMGRPQRGRAARPDAGDGPLRHLATGALVALVPVLLLALVLTAALVGPAWSLAIAVIATVGGLWLSRARAEARPRGPKGLARTVNLLQPIWSAAPSASSAWPTSSTE